MSTTQAPTTRSRPKRSRLPRQPRKGRLHKYQMLRERRRESPVSPSPPQQNKKRGGTKAMRTPLATMPLRQQGAPHLPRTTRHEHRKKTTVRWTLQQPGQRRHLRIRPFPIRKKNRASSGNLDLADVTKTADDISQDTTGRGSLNQNSHNGDDATASTAGHGSDAASGLLAETDARTHTEPNGTDAMYRDGTEDPGNAHGSDLGTLKTPASGHGPEDQVRKCSSNSDSGKARKEAGARKKLGSKSKR